MSETDNAAEQEVPGLTIGISGPSRKRTADRLIALGLRLYGAHTHYIRPGSKVDVSLLDGIVLSGGSHIHPELYGQQPTINARYDRLRDSTDQVLLTEAERLHLPVLGICRGAQLINVFRGGSLCQDVTPLRVKTRHRPLLLPLQPVGIVEPTRLGRIAGTRKIGANRIHSQAIQWLGSGLKVSAVDNDLFVQAIENTHGQWLMGVQWHPEYLLYHGVHRRIFRDFVRTAEQLKLARLTRGEYPEPEGPPPTSEGTDHE
ncbi:MULTISPECIES: gamma-glutamyl-gamma-aminobutyrate hydrolase family protein [Marinobacter]|uniref:Putative glutamine amidotransferase n=1 Tax=Marinobacter segnicrescens TaxID=430453 RepID=A0A1H9Z728_9GAMM|nr:MULTISPECIES: type 1 glutamine amidotransferase [Marinobacter]UZD64543.1 type 1 glutamine amidotransferase [Marinobacter sp. AN1]SES76859.1 putative glutamine amidotransferase [Marinobacter segnicrescens]